MIPASSLFSSVNPFWHGFITLLSLMCLDIFLRVICSNAIPWTKLRLTSPYFPGSSLTSFLKTGVIFPFSQSLGTTSSHHDLSKIVEIGLAVTSTRALQHWWEHTVKCSLIWYISNGSESSLLQTFPLVSGGLNCWTKSLLVNSRKNILTFSTFFVSILTHSTVGPLFP